MQDLPLVIICFNPNFHIKARLNPCDFTNSNESARLTHFDFIIFKQYFNNKCDFINFKPIFKKNSRLKVTLVILLILIPISTKMQGLLTPCDLINYEPKFNENARLTPCDFINF